MPTTHPTVGPEEDSEHVVPEWDGVDESEGDTDPDDEGVDAAPGEDPQ
jgi:hypothetical protein